MRDVLVRSRAAELAALLDGPLAVGGVPAGAPLPPALGLVTVLRSAGTALEGATAARPEFRDALRRRLVAVATVQAAAPAPVPAAVSWRVRAARSKGLGVAAGSLASLVAVSGVAVAGERSVPGEALYGLKRAVEDARLVTADGPLDEGARQLDLARTRLDEVAALAARDGDPDDIARGLADMDASTTAAAELLREASRAGDPAGLELLSAFAREQLADLSEVGPQLPAASRLRLTTSVVLLREVAADARDLLGIGTCSGACDPLAAAPGVPLAPGSALREGADACTCPPPAPAAPAPAAEDPAPAPRTGGSATPAPSPTAGDPSPGAEPSRAPSPSDEPDPLLPVPLPVPVPSGLPTDLPGSDLLDPVLDPLLDPLTGDAVGDLLDDDLGLAPLRALPLLSGPGAGLAALLSWWTGP